ncbi:Glucose-1-phosphate adenylyltransferase [compost metagenome]
MIVDSVVMPGVRIGRNVRLHRTIVAEGLVIPDGARLSPEDESDVLLVDQEELERRLRISMAGKA